MTDGCVKWIDWSPDDRWMCQWTDAHVDICTDGWVGWEGLGRAAKLHAHVTCGECDLGGPTQN